MAGCHSAAASGVGGLGAGVAAGFSAASTAGAAGFAAGAAAGLGALGAGAAAGFSAASAAGAAGFAAGAAAGLGALGAGAAAGFSAEVEMAVVFSDISGVRRLFADGVIVFYSFAYLIEKDNLPAIQNAGHITVLFYGRNLM